MYHRHTGRITAVALAATAATLSLTACQADGGTAAGTAPTPVAATVATASTTPSAAAPAKATPTTPAAPASRPAGTRSASAAPVPASPAATSSGTAPACTPDALEATAYQAAVRPPGTGTGAAVVQFTNVSAAACVLRGHPTVAGAGNGSPQHSVPLKVTRTGTAASVRLAPGGKAWVKLTFVQVQGEADGYCVSGATPSVFPTLVVGLPGAGKHQVALDDGVFAECDNKVTATAVTSVKPA
ncbi:DUF4232 domain-containing protein [Streptomyces cinerochromogenes]|uniref:DUF4232 domain-containing protein n=1 Tax=Streptomyces cinerochromogenes TaxID=66422 RepID=A0ABW7AXR9_9ACTN